MKIGIITMHKVLNFGSALQAYALQQTLFGLGFDNEIIDYQFPSVSHSKQTIKKRINGFFVYLRNAIMGFPNEKKISKFQNFYQENYILSSSRYNEKSIKANPPLYDIYMTGSDQVWNPKHVKDDTNFLLAFAPSGARKVSYASSFATSVLPEQYVSIYRKYLSEYNVISVREISGVEMVKYLTGKNATVCCDPTLLLDKEEWNVLEAKSDLKIKKKYILVYALYYMFDPYPELLNIINYVQKKLSLQVIYLNGRKEDAIRYNSKVYKSGGPEDFLRLIKNAEFIITSSFHGAVFSILYNKPFMGIVRDNNSADSRISSLLNNFNSEKCQVAYNDKINFSREELLNLKADMTEYNNIKKHAIDYLKESL